MTTSKFEVNEYGMLPIRSVKTLKDKKHHYIYDAENLLKHPNIQEAKRLLIDMKISEESISEFLENIAPWSDMWRLRTTTEDFKDSMIGISEMIAACRKEITSTMPESIRPTMGEVSLSRRKKIKNNDSKKKEYIFWRRIRKTSKNDISIVDALKAIESYFKKYNPDNYETLIKLRKIEPVPNTTNNKSLITRWVFLQMLDIDELGGRLLNKDHLVNKNKVISLIASTLLSENIPPNSVTNHLKNMRTLQYNQDTEDVVITKKRNSNLR